MSVAVIICAAGQGSRAGFSKNKLLVPLQGAPVLYHTVKKFIDFGVDRIVIAVNADDQAEVQAVCQGLPAQTVIGGATRTQSVFNALQAVEEEFVLIHDGARPFIRAEQIAACLESVKAFGSGICAVACTDTIAVAQDGEVQNVPDRRTLFAVQTPQGFVTSEIKGAYKQAISDGKTYTDDASVYSAYVRAAHLCDGHPTNKKLTYAQDFDLPLPSTLPNGDRVGYGIDTHAFGKAQLFVTLGGVRIDCNCGLVAHSDGDVLVHAVMDAVLSAAGLKDIGHYFPDTDQTWKNADSMKMLKTVVDLALDAGYVPVNASVTVQAEKPRLAKHIDEMTKNLANALHLLPDQVAIAAGTSEKLGFVGEGKGIVATAAVLCKRK